MTAFDRFESRLPELMTDLATPGIPDYFDSLLQVAARTPQRPAWRSLERWLPMGAIARFVPIGAVPWRLVLTGLLLIVLAASALLFYVGARQRPLPAPFGPARNGTLLMSTMSRDIVAVDPTTGSMTPVLPGAGVAVNFSPDGQWFFYDGGTAGRTETFLAKADGSGAHLVWTGMEPQRETWVDWAQGGATLIAAAGADGATDVTLLDATSGATTIAHFDRAFVNVARPYGTNQLLLTPPDDVPGNYWLANADGSNLHELPTDGRMGWGNLSPDGSKFAYTTWGEGIGEQGRTHVLDLASGTDDLITGRLPGYTWVEPVFAPDGATLAVQRWTSSGEAVVAIVSVAEKETLRVLGMPHEGRAGLWAFFSPDGAQLLVRYEDDQSTWLFDLASGEGRALPGATGFITWQRVGAE